MTRSRRLAVVLVGSLLLIGAVAATPTMLGAATAAPTMLGTATAAPATLDAADGTELTASPADAGAESTHTWTFDDVDYDGEVDAITVDYPVGTSFDGLTNDDVTVEITREGESEPTDISVNSDEYGGSAATFDLSGWYNTDIDGPVTVTIDGLENPPAGEHTATLTFDGDDAVSAEAEFTVEDGDDGEPEPGDPVDADLELAPDTSEAASVHTWSFDDVDYDGEVDAITVDYPTETSFDGLTDDDVTVEMTRDIDDDGPTEISVNSGEYEGSQATFDLSGNYNTDIDGPVMVTIDGLENPPAGEYTAILTFDGDDTVSAAAEFTVDDPADALAATVVDADGDPVADSDVVLELEGPTDEVVLAETDAAGVVTADLAAGEYDVTVTAPDAGTATETVDVSGPTEATLETTVPETGTIQALLTDADGETLPAGTWATLDGDDLEAPLTGQVDEDGFLTLTGVAPGEYALSAETAATGVTEPADVTVSAGETATVEFTDGDEPTTATLAGSVTTPDGAALANEPIVVEYDGAETGVTTLVTDATGEFELPFVAAGEYDVTVTAQGFAASDLVTVDVAAGESADVTLEEPESGSISGVVTDEDGDPLEEETWVTFSADGFDADKTDQLGPGGEFSIDEIAPGSYDIVAETLNYGVTDEHKVNVATGETSGVEISYVPDDSPGQGPPSGVPGGGNPGNGNGGGPPGHAGPGNGGGPPGHAGSASSVTVLA